MTASRRRGRRTRSQRVRTVDQAVALELKRVSCHCKPELEMATLGPGVHVMEIQHDAWCLAIHDPQEN